MTLYAGLGMAGVVLCAGLVKFSLDWMEVARNARQKREANSSARQELVPYVAICETGSLQPVCPVLPPMAHN